MFDSFERQEGARYRPWDGPPRYLLAHTHPAKRGVRSARVLRDYRSTMWSGRGTGREQPTRDPQRLPAIDRGPPLKRGRWRTESRKTPTPLDAPLARGQSVYSDGGASSFVHWPDKQNSRRKE